MVFIHAEGAGDGLEVLGFAESFLERNAVQRLAAAEGVAKEFGFVIAQGVEGVGIPAVFGLESGDEVLNQGILVKRRIVVGEVHVVEVLGSGQAHQVRRVKAVGAQDGGGDAQLTSLLDDQAGLLIVAGDVDDIGVQVLDGGENRLEVLVVGAVGFFLQDGAQSIGGVGSHCGALIGVAVADPESVLLDLAVGNGDVVRRGGTGDHRNLVPIGVGDLRLERTGGSRPKDRDNFILLHQAFAQSRCLGFVGLGVVFHQLDGLAVDAAGCVYLVDGHLDAVHGALAVGGHAAAQLVAQADLNGGRTVFYFISFCSRSAASGKDTGRKRRCTKHTKKLFHNENPFSSELNSVNRAESNVMNRF